MKKMKGFIDPISLGFLISIIGSTAAYVAHKNDNSLPDKTNTNIESSTLMEKTTVEMHNIKPEG